MASANWINTAGGSWSTPSGWRTGAVPGAGSDDIATIGALGTYTVTVGGAGLAALPIGAVMLTGAGATLAVGYSGLVVRTTLLAASGTLQLGGTLKGGTLNLRGATVTVPISTGSSTARLDGVSVSGTLDISTSSGILALANGVSFAAADASTPGTLILGGSGGLLAEDNETLDNVAILAASGAPSLYLGYGTAALTVTLGQAGALQVAGTLLLAGRGSFVNAGSILVQSGGRLTVAAGVGLARAAGSGSLTVAQGGTMAFAGASGTTIAPGGLSGALIAGTLSIDGVSTTGALTAALAGATITGTVMLTAMLENADATLEVNATGPVPTLALNGGTIHGGTLRLAGGAFVANPGAFSGGPGTLDGVRVLGALGLGFGSGTVLALRGGVTFGGLDGTGRGALVLGQPQAELRVLDAETLDHVQIAFGAAGGFALLTTAPGLALTLGADAALTVAGQGAIGGGGQFVNGGAIVVQSGALLEVLAGTILAAAPAPGAIQLQSGGTLKLDAAAGTTLALGGLAGGSYAGTLALNGATTTAAVQAGLAGAAFTGVLEVDAALDNTGSTLSLAAGTLFGAVVLNGVLRGGIVRAGGGLLSTGTAAVLDGVALRGPFSLSGAVVQIRNGLTLQGLGGTGAGSLTLAQGLTALDAETLANAVLVMAPRFGTAVLTGAAGAALTLATSLTLQVAGTTSLVSGAGGSVVNQGLIQVAGNQTLLVDQGFQSSGAIQLAYGARLVLSGTLSTAALPALIYGISGPGSLGLAAGSVLANAGQTLTLAAGSRLGSLVIPSGTIRGGTVVASGGALSVGALVLDGVTWRGVLAGSGTAAASYTFLNGTVVRSSSGGAGTIDLSNAGNTLLFGTLLDGVSVRLAGGTLGATAAGGSSTIGSGATVTIAGTGTTQENLLGTLTSRGTMAVTSAAVTAGAFANAGTLSVTGGSFSAAGFSNSGMVVLNSGTLALAAPSLLGGTVRFADQAGRLVFQGYGLNGATLQDFQYGDRVDLSALGYSSQLSLSLAGNVLSVFQGATAVANLTLQGGGTTAYAAQQFTLSANGVGGTSLTTTHRLYAPAFTGVARDFDAAYYLARYPDIAASGTDPLQHYLSIGWKEGRDPNAWFSTTWYLNQNPDVAAAGTNPLIDFVSTGWKAGRDPSALFSVSGYLAANPDVAAAGIDPLQHYLLYGKAEGRTTTPATPHAVGPQDPLVDRIWYLAQHPDVAASGMDASQHYNTIGWKLGYNPDPWFDTTFYLKSNPDVARAGINPLVHFEQHGWSEGREPSLAFSDRSYLATYKDVAQSKIDPLLHYMTFGRFEGRMTFVNGPSAATTPDPLVDRAYYYAQLATIVPSAADATASYNQTGWKMKLNPDAWFDTSYYLSRYPDIQRAGVNPLQHYETYGWKEGRDPSAAFSTRKYLAAYADVQAANVNPLLEYVTTGAAAGRTAFAV